MLCCALFTNNPLMLEKKLTEHFVSGTSLDVLKAARDCIHVGGILLTHPLYGNLRPHQQPFRTILMKAPQVQSLDIESLSLIESALEVYMSERHRLVVPEDMSETMRADYAFVDFELMRESFAEYGIL